MCSDLYYDSVERRLDLELLDDSDPFEVDRQLGHLSKHGGADVTLVQEIWRSEPLFYPALPPAHWLMVAEIGGVVWQVPIAPARDGDPARCRPIGCYVASVSAAASYRRDRWL